MDSIASQDVFGTMVEETTSSGYAHRHLSAWDAQDAFLGVVSATRSRLHEDQRLKKKLFAEFIYGLVRFADVVLSFIHSSRGKPTHLSAIELIETFTICCTLNVKNSSTAAFGNPLILTLLTALGNIFQPSRESFRERFLRHTTETQRLLRSVGLSLLVRYPLPSSAPPYFTALRLSFYPFS